LLPLNDETEPSAGPTVAEVPLGAARDILVDYLDVEARPDDCYVVVIGSVARLDIEALCRGDGMPADSEAAWLRINLERIPPLRLGDLKVDFGNLPLRDPPQEGEMLDGFVIGRTIYRSRYTLLRRALDTIDNRTVLLKFPLRTMLQDQVFQAGFLREAWVGQTVNSKWIADYLTLAPGRQSCLYIALPFYRGDTLEERLSRRPPIGFAEGMSIALRLCEAVDDLDRIQVIHHDLKPENIVLPNDGGLRLLDFGLAYLPGIDDSAEERLGGTTRYMAPELFRAAPPDARSEVFSLAVTIYRMFSGGPFPFGQWEKQPLSRKRPDLPAWLGKCLGQALAADPASRFANAASFAQALEAGLKEGNPKPLLHHSWQLRAGNLRFWKILTAIFAAAFIITLFLLQKR
jgi:serine/threonine protein kinase